jgi:hypothetical protein
MTPADLTAAGRALYGEFWQIPLSRDLGVSKMSVRRWHSGYRKIPDRVEEDVIELLAARQVERIRDIISTNGSSTNGSSTNGCVLAVYDSDDDLRQVSGDEWSAQFHGRMIGRMIDSLRAESVIVRTVPIGARDYFRWLGRRQNAPSARAEYAAFHAAPYAS